jgi:hypothetical protein
MPEKNDEVFSKNPAQIILRPIRFLAISFYLCALAIGAIAIEPVRIRTHFLIAKHLQQHTFYITTQYQIII